MRKFILFILGVLLLGTSMMGEEKSSKPLKDELSFGLGAGFGTVIISDVSWFSFFASYMHDISKRVSLGVTVSHTFMMEKSIFSPSKVSTMVGVGFSPKLRLYYYHGKKTRLYGDIGSGYRFVQFTFLGADYMEKNIGYFLKIGVGIEGFLSAGISYRF